MPAWQAKKYIPKASIELCALYKEIFIEEFKGEITEYFNPVVIQEGGIS